MNITGEMRDLLLAIWALKNIQKFLRFKRDRQIIKDALKRLKSVEQFLLARVKHKETIHAKVRPT